MWRQDTGKAALTRAKMSRRDVRWNASRASSKANRSTWRHGMQVSGRNAIGWEDRLARDVEYVDGPSPALDVEIVLATLGSE